MNLDGKIPIDPILGLPGEHAELFLIGFYIFYIFTRNCAGGESDLQQRVRELRDVLLRDVTARCCPETESSDSAP